MVQCVRDWSYAGIIEALYKTYTQKQEKIILGDKTTSYLSELPLLKLLIPQAKFIHIIRDTRDYCLSYNKAFGKNIYRAAQRWHDSIIKCRQDAKEFTSTDCLEVHYEKLCVLPDYTMKSICNFLDVPYETNMIRLNKPTEKVGDAKNFVGISKHNYGKWEKCLGEDSIVKIERICGSLLSELGYPVSYHGEEQRLTQIELIVYKILDGFNVLYLRIKKQNLVKVLNNTAKSTIHRIAWKGY